MSTLILALCSAFGDREHDCGTRTHSKLLRLAGKVYASTLELEESAQFPLASRLQFRALEVEGLLESAFASPTIASRRNYLTLALESIQKGQETLDHALENGLLLERADQRQLCLYFRCNPRSWPVRTPKCSSSEITDLLAAKANNLPAPLAPQAAQILNRIRWAGEAAIWVPDFKHSEPLTAPYSISNNTRRLLAKTRSIKKNTKLCTKKS